MTVPLRSTVACLLTLAPLPTTALAQAVAPSTPVEGDKAPADAEIIVTAPSERGRPIGSGVPDIRINQAEIATYGADSIGDLLADLKPQTGESPVILVNGRRVSGLDEISRLPPEAIARVDILPEEVALNYGYRADQRVVNIVLVQQFRAVSADLRLTLPTEGGRSEGQVNATYARLDAKGRMSLDLAYGRDSQLTEAERDLAGPDAPYRTLMPSAEQIGLGGTLNRTIFAKVSATFSGRLDHRTGASLFGLPLDPLAPGPLAGHTRSTGGHLGLALNSRAAGWNWSFTGAYDRTHSLSETDRNGPAGGVTADRQRTTSSNGSADLVANGTILTLPAGKVSTTVKAGIARREQQSETLRSSLVERRERGGTQTQFSANLNLPIASRKRDVLAALGDLSAYVNLSHDGLSGVGGADTFGYGLSWAPVPALRISATMTRADGLPSQTQRDDPLMLTPNVPIYDFVTGRTVAVTRIDGGNPSLRADKRRIFSLSGRYKPFERSSLTLNLSYSHTQIRDQLGRLPAVTAAIEAAFPERFVRDAAGDLVSFDARPVNFARAEQRQLSWGLFWSQPIGKPRRPGARPYRAPLPPPGSQPVQGADEEATVAAAADQGAPMAGPPGFGRGGGAPGQGRVLLSLNHVWRMQNDILIRRGLPTLDLLGGDAFGRGQARHQINARANVMKDGLGATFEASWQSASKLHGSTGDLAFSDLATFNLRVFANLEEQFRAPFFRKTRVSLNVNNLFAARLRVRDRFGATPLSYSPAYLDPLGRSVMLGLRKLF